MNSHFVSEKPIIYADMNVYRYLACGDISILEPERFIWVYSFVHLNEIHRNGNKDALVGMKLLKAVEICDVLDEKFQSVGNVVLRGYIDPYVKYKNHLNAITGYENTSDFMVEHLLHVYGADNFKELSETPDQMRNEIEKITSIIDDDRRQQVIEKAQFVSDSWKESIEENLKEHMPIDKTRKAMGITSEDRKRIEKSKCAIDEIWRLIPSSVTNNITKDQFFGFESNPWIEGIQHTQYSGIAGAYIILNMIGISPDKGLAKREKIKNIISDSQHVGMASYCNTFISADRNVVNNALCIYAYLKNITNALHFEYKNGYELNL